MHNSYDEFYGGRSPQRDSGLHSVNSSPLLHYSSANMTAGKYPSCGVDEAFSSPREEHSRRYSTPDHIRPTIRSSSTSEFMPRRYLHINHHLHLHRSTVSSPYDSKRHPLHSPRGPQQEQFSHQSSQQPQQPQSRDIDSIYGQFGNFQDWASQAALRSRKSSLVFERSVTSFSSDNIHIASPASSSSSSSNNLRQHRQIPIPYHAAGIQHEEEVVLVKTPSPSTSALHSARGSQVVMILPTADLAPDWFDEEGEECISTLQLDNVERQQGNGYKRGYHKSSDTRSTVQSPLLVHRSGSLGSVDVGYMNKDRRNASSPCSIGPVVSEAASRVSAHHFVEQDSNSYTPLIYSRRCTLPATSSAMFNSGVQKDVHTKIPTPRAQAATGYFAMGESEHVWRPF